MLIQVAKLDAMRLQLNPSLQRRMSKERDLIKDGMK
jgi:hypothetical protein